MFKKHGKLLALFSFTPAYLFYVLPFTKLGGSLVYMFVNVYVNTLL